MNHSLIKYKIIPLVLLGVIISTFLFLFRRQAFIEEAIFKLQYELPLKEQEMLQRSSTISAQQINTVGRAVTAAQVWRPIQEKVRDTVVQIFAQIAGVDILQPYKPPVQGAAYGSGFFINDQGCLITNAHVINFGQAKAIWIQIPSLGKQIIDVEVIGMSPERDVALLQIKPESLEIIKKQLGTIPFLHLGDSDAVLRSDEVLALGYPLGQHSLKSTTGVISGRERHLIQISAPINPGSSGGPLLNNNGDVIGINSSGIQEAQNVGYAIAINDLKMILPDLHKEKILRKPFLGVFFNNGSTALTDYLGNPQPGGCYVAGVVSGSTLERAGVQRGDMIYAINGYPVDIFGEMRVPWTEDKISVVDYVGRLSTGQNITIVIYRNGVRKEFTLEFSLATLPAIRKVYPGYEKMDYEVFGGMVVMELTINHIQLLVEQATGLAQYAELKNQAKPVLLITHILPNSQAYRSRSLMVGMTLHEVNGMRVNSLDDFRKAIKKGVNSPFFTIVAVDNVTRASDNIFVVLEYNKILPDEMRFSTDFKYPLSNTVKDLLRAAKAEAVLDKKDYLNNEVVNKTVTKGIQVAVRD